MKLFAACAFGLEAVVKRELEALGYQPKVEQPGRVAFEGDASAICRANLWLRSADRISICLAQFDCPDFDALFDTIKAMDWNEWLTADAAFPVTGRSRKSKLTSVPAVQRSVKRALVEGMMRSFNTEELPESGERYPIDIALLDDVATLTLDTTGPSLHKRGYRKLVGPAPLKETLAAALIQLSVWKANRPLLDPFCGSGTIPIEAALIGLNMAPGLNRTFPSQHWPLVPREKWTAAVEEALDLQTPDVDLQIIGTDSDAEVLELARFHARRAGVDGKIHFQQKSFSDLRSKREYGCIITNPPYGERLNEQKKLQSLYESIPAVLQRLPTWSHFILTSMPLEKIIKQQATRRRKLFNGRIECHYFQFLGPRPPRPVDQTATPTEPVLEDEPKSAADTESPAKSTPTEKPSSAVFGGLTEKDHEQAELFKTRLQKRARHFRRWPKRGVTCFRLYEKDIPELPFVVDRYDDSLHITEYERPHDRDFGRHGAWLELMKKSAASALDVPIQKVHLKSRERQRGAKQYQRMDQSRQFKQVIEQGLTFLVNLTDYVDTGLFLDHRVTRSMIREAAEGKRFLNLFAYTGSFSVYAGAGGAHSTTTVDLSKNYLDWAKRNMKTNGFESDNHRFIHADARQFIAAAQNRGEKYDLVVVDPPTFSNSKQTDQDWDVQQHHVDLLSELSTILDDEAVVFFSTNFRRFKLDEDSLNSLYRIVEISKQTVPEDFRNRRIHRCWKLFKLPQN